MRIRRLEIHLDIERDLHRAFDATDRELMDAAALSFFYGDVRGLDVLLGDHGFAGLDEFIQFPTERMRDEGGGFFQSGVTGGAGFEAGLEFRWRPTAADLSLQRTAPRGGIDDALDVDGLDLATDAGEADGQDVHDETGIHAGAEDTGAAGFASGIKLGGEFRFAQGGVKEFFTGRDDADAVAHDRFDLAERRAHFGDGRVEDHVGLGYLEQFLERAVNFGAAHFGVTRNFCQRLADESGVDVDAADDFCPRFGGGQLEGFDADGAESELCDLDFFHGG